MKFLILAFVATLTQGFDDRIVGGSVEEPHVLPFIANIKRNGGLMCGVNVVTMTTSQTSFRHFVVTSKQDSLVVTLGDVTLSKFEKSEQVFRIKDQIQHPNFDPDTYLNDVMLIQIDGYVTLNEEVKLAVLSHTPPAVGTDCSVYGWGTTSFGGEVSDDLLSVKVAVVSDEECRSIYGDYIKNGMICLGSFDGSSKDACQGDSGGPAVCDGSVAGLTSFGINCGIYPGVYIKVSDYIEWIEELI